MFAASRLEGCSVGTSVLQTIGLVSRLMADNTQHERVMSRATSGTNYENVLRRMRHFGKLASYSVFCFKMFRFV
ncbi:hypothetical protein QWZ16_12465 [Vibrio ostreicida]|uniref:Uncharacterized protein n=1 Tax=Vibrio ostreicida TaxID=526588 RepID=A0ABT8BU37_9VIBR|nr:hypothetical protein [Vibrio ostreicida]MDN3610516.1 hypothetical protein [Vibrio ostreicida]